MPLDLNQPPTNKRLEQTGLPFDFDERDTATLLVARGETGLFELVLPYFRENASTRECDLLVKIYRDSGVSSAALSLGHVSTLGEVISLYETLSQKKWPGCD